METLPVLVSYTINNVAYSSFITKIDANLSDRNVTNPREPRHWRNPASHFLPSTNSQTNSRTTTDHPYHSRPSSRHVPLTTLPSKTFERPRGRGSLKQKTPPHRQKRAVISLNPTQACLPGSHHAILGRTESPLSRLTSLAINFNLTFFSVAILAFRGLQLPCQKLYR